MALVPLRYNVRSMFARPGATLLTVLSIAATTAVLAGLLSLQQGFATIFTERGRTDLLVLLRPGATSEGESSFDRDRAQIAMKEIPEIALDGGGQPLASGENFLAMLLPKADGGMTNVTLRGVQPQTFAIHGSDFRIVEGRNLTPGNDEVIVGRSLVERMEDCQVGKDLQINVTAFRIVGTFELKGGYQSEIWGDVDRMMAALDTSLFSRILARLEPGADVAALTERLENDKRVPAKALTERDYLMSQTSALSGLFTALGAVLAVIMGLAAVFTGINAMLSAIAARTHEIGVLLATGFRPWAVFLAFQLEALLLGLLGGAVGCLLVLPLQGMQTGTTNFQTFTEVTFAFRSTPWALGVSMAFAVALGLVGGAWPAFRAARLLPTQALRRA